jgi:serine/threonine protein kinase/pimeloyl-ACP methyl ester carboxylesterase/Tfp pilus assembly protein PilF
MQQEIRFCHAPDGVRIAYAIAGSGPPLVKAANWLNHLEFDWQSPLWRHLFEDLAGRHTLVRYDERGNGLSDWNAADLSFDSFVTDLETVVDAAGLDRFPLLGISQGGAVAVAYAVRHPQRVSHLILFGAYAKGWAARNDPADMEKREAMITLIRQGWGQDNPAFRQMWSTLYIPEGTREQVDWFNELQRISTSPENAVRLMRTVGSIDVGSLLPQIKAPTLVLHCRGDAAVPFEAGRLMAARIPGARFVELPGNNHLLLDGTPAWLRFRDELHAFLGGAPRGRSAPSEPVAARSASASGESTYIAAQWRPGAEVGPYRIASALGAGGMGVVYRARDTRLDRDVALKVLPDAMVADATARARLVREARTASALNHPNICHIYDVGESGGHSYIAMEHVEGRPLSQSIPAEGLPLDTALRYAGQLAEALAHAHDRGVLHRDLKSANVMITPEGSVKVLDFGLAKRAATGSADDATRAADSVTQAGSVAGTLHYLAPELLRGQPADARSDLWALGVILFEMASGKLPFTGRTGFEASAAILREPTAPLPAHVPAGMRAIIARCLAKEPAQRYQRASELRAALEAISSDTASHPIAAPPPSAPAHATGAIPASEAPPPRSGVSGVVQSIFASQSATAKESWSVLGIWFAWIAGLIVLWGLYLLVTGQVSSWFGADRPATETTSAVPSPASTPATDGPRLSTGGTPSANAEANAYFEKAQLFLRGAFDPVRARDLLEKALQADPKFSDARAVYALTHLLQVESGISNATAWIYKAEQEVRQALRDDPNCAAAQSVLGGLYLFQGKKELAAEQFRRILKDAPLQVSARIGMLHYHRMSGEYREGAALARQTSEFLRVFSINQLLLGNLLHESGDSAAAVREFVGVLDQDAPNHFALKELARGHIETGDTRTARTFLERIRKSDRQNCRVRLGWALLYAREGRRRDALREMDAELLKYAEVNPNVTLEAAEFYALLGENSQALDWLEKAVRNGDERVEWFRRDPLLESIRNEFRFKSLLDSIAFRRQQKNQ